MKIVVLDGYTENPGDLSWSGLEALGEVVVYDRTSYVDAPVIAQRIGGAKESRQCIMDCSIENVRAFLNGTPQNVVNG